MTNATNISVKHSTRISCEFITRAMAVKDVAIIGCGVSGLSSIKCCLETGLKPTCFEQQSNFGGVWNYTDDPRPNLASAHKSTITNTSKLLTGFSDFPLPKEFPNYVPQSLMQEYLKMYAQKFDLLKHVQFNTEVVKLERSADHGATGKWVVSTRKVGETTDEITYKTFDAVMICNGHFSDKVMPDFPGMEKFKGSIIHSGDYRTFHPYIGKRVVVIGSSHSAADIAVELSYHSKQVYMSSRSGFYVLTRINGGQTLDSSLTRAMSLLPLQYLLKFHPSLVNNKVDFRNLGLEPKGILGVQKFPIVNDAIHHRVITGCIKVKGDVQEIAENSVTIKGGETLENIDALVVATGFKLNYPFAEDIIEVKDNHYTSLYKHMFLPADKWHTLAVIGAVGVSGPFPPVTEMQGRFAVEVFAGRCKLPSKDEMKKEISDREQQLLKTGTSKHYFTRVNYLVYMDELAEMIGVKPNLWSLLKQDPKLAYHVFFDNIVASQYRLQGPHTWKGAREHIISLQEQYLFPLATRKCAKKSSHHSFLILSLFAVVFAVVIIMLKS